MTGQPCPADMAAGRFASVFVKRNRYTLYFAFTETGRCLKQMKTFKFPYLALILGLFLFLLVMKGSVTDSNGVTAIPLLTLLIVSEFAFFVTASAVYIGVKHMRTAGITSAYAATTVACFLLSIRFMLYGISLWPL